MPRKTVDIVGLVERVNRALTDAADFQDRTMAPDEAKAFRRGMAAVLEDALHSARAYKGFRYSDPRAKHDENGIIEGTYDDTRRTYFL